MSMKDAQRLDVLLVERGLAQSREKARALILAGQVLVHGQKVDKAGHSVSIDSKIEVLESPKYVGPGGLKLEAALDHFRIQTAGILCLDIGSSPSGFLSSLLSTVSPPACAPASYTRPTASSRRDPL